MSLHRRLAALEKKRRAASAEDNKILGIIDYRDSQGFTEWDGVHKPGVQVIGVIRGIRIPPEEWPERCRAQQKKLLEDLVAYEADLESEERSVEHGKDTSPASVGFTDQLAPGAKPKPYRYYTDATGTEWQVEVATGQKWKV